MLFTLHDRMQLELTGTDRAKFLHGFCTNDVKGLSPGQGCEAFVCNIQGKVLGHIFVFCSESSLWIDGAPGQDDALVRHLDKYLINEDVQIACRTAEYETLYVHQSPLPEPLQRLAGDQAHRLLEAPVLSHATIPVDSAVVHLRRVDWLGEPAWLIGVPRALLHGCLADLPTPRGEQSQWDSLRIDAGFPLYGTDITSDNLAQEVNRTARCISFAKGCYLGQEPIARIDALGHVNRELRRMAVSGDALPAAGATLLDPESGAEIGAITSAAPSAREPGKFAALGYVRTKFGGRTAVLSSTSAVVELR